MDKRAEEFKALVAISNNAKRMYDAARDRARKTKDPHDIQEEKDLLKAYEAAVHQVASLPLD